MGNVYLWYIFSKSLGSILGNASAHQIDYELSQSNDPDALIENYRKDANSYYCGIGYRRIVAEGKANRVVSYLNDYEERRNEVFSMFNNYIYNLI